MKIQIGGKRTRHKHGVDRENECFIISSKIAFTSDVVITAAEGTFLKFKLSITILLSYGRLLNESRDPDAMALCGRGLLMWWPDRFMALKQQDGLK